MKAKKLLSILLCLVMMCTLLPMTALAEGEAIISHVDIVNAPTLVAGQKLNSISASTITSGVTITNVQVWETACNGTVNTNIEIKPDTYYDIDVYITAAEGYKLASHTEMTATINGVWTTYIGYSALNSSEMVLNLRVMPNKPTPAAVTGISIDPASASVEQGKTLQFTATVSGTGDFNKNVAWSVSGAASTIDATGLLTVGAAETATTLTVTATAEGDPSKTASATVTVTEPAPPAHTHTSVKKDGQAPTCKYDGWKDYYECTCGLFTDEGCTDPIEDLDAWKAGNGRIPTPGHPMLPNYDSTHHWSECAVDNCDDPDTAKSSPEAHYDTDPKDFECDFCYYDMRTKLTSAAFNILNLKPKGKLSDISYKVPQGVQTLQPTYAIDVDEATLDGTEVPISTVIEYETQYWVGLPIAAKPGYALPDCDPALFTLDGQAAIDVIHVGSEQDADGSEVSAEYIAVFKLPVIPAPPTGHGHSYAQGDYKHDDTYHWQECSAADCNDRAGSIINKAKHKGGTATCIAKAECSVCGEEYGKKLAHEYSDWVVVKEPTDTTYGKKERTCSLCKGVHMEYIPPLGQNPKTGDTNDVFLWGAALAASLLGLTGVVVYTKKKREE